MSNPIAETELVQFVLSVINDAGVTGISAVDGVTPVAIGVYSQPIENAALPYVRVGFTDTLNIGDEPMNYDYVPTAKTIHLMLDVFSDYNNVISTLSIGSQLQTLLQHTEVTTTHLHGNTWLKSVDYFTDNETNPDRALSRASLRIECRVQLGAYTPMSPHNVVTVLFSATPIFDCSQGDTFVITLTGNVTSSTIINFAPDTKVSFIINQDGSGDRTFVWPSNVYDAVTINSTASSTSIDQFISPDGSNFYALGIGI